MAYEQKPGQGSLFKNEKTQENQPDYTGTMVTPAGVECKVSAWVKRPEGKKPFLSLSIQAKEQSVTSTPQQAYEAKPVQATSDDVPF